MVETIRDKSVTDNDFLEQLQNLEQKIACLKELSFREVSFSSLKVISITNQINLKNWPKNQIAKSSKLIQKSLEQRENLILQMTNQTDRVWKSIMSNHDLRPNHDFTIQLNTNDQFLIKCQNKEKT